MLSMRSLMPWSGHRSIRHGKFGEVHPLDVLSRDMERLFEDYWRGFDLPMFNRLERPFTAMMPKMDMMEDESEYRLVVELPGMDEKDIEVSMSDDFLIIKGEKKVEKEDDEKSYFVKERTYGSFHRSIPLDVDVLADKVEARFDKGVLTVVLPKSPEAKMKYTKIPVNVSAEVKKMEKKAA